MGRNKGFFRWKRGIAKRTFSLVLVFAMIAAMLQTMPGLQTVWAAEENVLSVMGPAGGDESVGVDDTEAVPETEGEPTALSDSPAVTVEGNTVTFTVTDANAAEIKIAGSFTNWGDGAVAMTKNGNTFTYTKEGLEPGKYEYKFIRGGAWDPDPNRLFWIEGITAPTDCKVVRGGNEYTLPATFPKYVDGQNDPDQAPVTSYSMESVNGITFDSANNTLKADGSCEAEELTLTATVEGQTIELKVAVVDEPITLRVHYIRADKDYDGWDCYTWESGAETKDFTVVDGEAIAEFQIDGRQYTGFNYIIRKGGDSWTEKDVATNQWIDLSDILSGTVDYYITSGVEGGEIKLGPDVVKGVKISSVEYKSGKVIVTIGSEASEVEGTAQDLFSIKDEDGNAVKIEDAETSGKQFILTVGVDMSGMDGTQKKYFLVYEGFEYEITLPDLFSSEEFEAAYTYEGNDLGATWSQSETTFKVWAPTATAMSVKLYASGTEGTADLQKKETMEKGEKGVWTATVSGNLNGTYYTYEATVDGKTVETCDPYARTTGVNGKRAMVINLDSTDPEGWDSDVSPHKGLTYTDSVIYELHVRDFSIDESSGISAEHKGKFLGLTEKGTTNATGQTTGLDYLKDLGVTHIHLLPFYDYGSVDNVIKLIANCLKGLDSFLRSNTFF